MTQGTELSSSSLQSAAILTHTNNRHSCQCLIEVFGKSLDFPLDLRFLTIQVNTRVKAYLIAGQYPPSWILAKHQ